MISDDVTSFTAYAQETISGGQFVKAVSDNDVIEAGSVAAYAASDIAVAKMDAGADNELVVGIALETATSGNSITVGTKGIYILPAGADAIGVGKALMPGSDTTAFANTVQLVADGNEEFKVGKALTGASASGKYIAALVRI
ncbi:MAG: DUF2190 family protein [Deltaproteobacteria bacterium]|nr:DUF2190 family protein [Deltaproteobacteria bacterium]